MCSFMLQVYPRPGGEVYICGVSEDNVPVPATAADVHPRPAAIAQLQGVAASVSQASEHECWAANHAFTMLPALRRAVVMER